MMDNDDFTGPFNIGNPTEFTMLELANVVKEVVNPEAVIEFRENTADDPKCRKPNIEMVRWGTCGALFVLARHCVFQDACLVVGWLPVALSCIGK